MRTAADTGRDGENQNQVWTKNRLVLTRLHGSTYSIYSTWIYVFSKCCPKQSVGSTSTALPERKKAWRGRLSHNKGSVLWQSQWYSWRLRRVVVMCRVSIVTKGKSVGHCLFVVFKVVVVVVLVVVVAANAHVRLVCLARQSQFWLPVGLWESEFVFKRILICTVWFCVGSTWSITVAIIV